MSSTSQVVAGLGALAERHRHTAEGFTRRARRLASLRMWVFLSGSMLFALSDRLPGARWVWLGTAAALAVAFLALVIRHRAARRGAERWTTAAGLAADALARVQRRWDDLPAPASPPDSAGAAHPYAADLDLYGRASVRSLTGPVFTPMGRDSLDEWLLRGALPADVGARQDASRELAARHQLREAVAIEGALLEPVGRETLNRFLSWLEADPTVLGRWWGPLRWLLPLATGTLVIADAMDLLPPGPWVLGLLIQAALAWRVGPAIHASFGQASSGSPGLRRYHRLFRAWEAAPVQAPLLRHHRGRLGEGPTSASAALVSLRKWLDAADARASGLLHPPLAIGLLWDLHVGAGLDRWRRRSGAAAPDWLESLGVLEALSALGALGAENPDWIYPELTEEEPVRFVARGLGHPLLEPDACVRNDVTVGPPGTVLLVTGSNMSGKSTLLRSIGTAVVLGGAGAPVCAVALRLPAVRLVTSMRVHDSLSEGVSQFMAELTRLRVLLDAAPHAEEAAAPPLLFLIDEVLQGTNSEERRIAGRRVIRRLLSRSAVGAVTTHDLDLHRDPIVETAAVLAHFRESVSEGDGPVELTFDYRLRPGLATTRNALLLAERMGITED